MKPYEPWCLGNEGAMGTTVGCHENDCAMETMVPWEPWCHGNYCAMETMVPWELMCHWNFGAIGTIVP